MCLGKLLHRKDNRRIGHVDDGIHAVNVSADPLIEISKPAPSIRRSREPTESISAQCLSWKPWWSTKH
jgi:hypothetical protein